MSTTNRSSANKPADSRLWLALRLRDLPLNALGLCSLESDAQTQPALVVIEKQRVICANQTAQAAGVEYGMDTTSAQILSQCTAHPRDKTQEEQALAQLAERLYQFTPYIEHYTCTLKPDTGLLLELSRCLQLFSGLAALTQRIVASLQETIFAVSYGLAHSAMGAWLLSYQSNQPPAINGTENKTLFCAQLNSVPIAYLYDYPHAVDALHNTGFVTLGDIARQISAQSISSIKKRFGVDFTEMLCGIFLIEHNFQQSSLFDKPLAVHQPVELFCESIQFDYPVRQSDQLHQPAEYLLQKLSDYLRKRQLQCQKITWQLFDIYRNREELTVLCDNPQTHWRLLYDLTLIQLQQRQLPFEVDNLELHCPQPTAVQNRSQNLGFDHRRQSAGHSHSFAITAAKLKARLGESAVFKLSYRDSYIPEQTNARIALSDTSQQQLPAAHTTALRPSWLFDTPVQLEIRHDNLYWRGQLTLIAGPERIQGNWWSTPTARDYFVAQRHDHLRLWVFLDLHKNTWYAQGIFA